MTLKISVLSLTYLRNLEQDVYLSSLINVFLLVTFSMR